MTRRSSIEKILGQYSTVETFPTGDGDEIHRMEKNRGKAYRTSVPEDELPDILFVKGLFLGQVKGEVDDSNIPF